MTTMRYVALDYGDKKVGIAVSNEDGTMGFPLRVVKNDSALFPCVLELVREYGAEVVMGDSRTLAGVENPIAKEIHAFADKLVLEGVPVHFEPEYFTSKEAERIQGRTANTDASAAALMLTSFLTRTRNTH